MIVKKINYKTFKTTLSKLLTFNKVRFDKPAEYDDFYNRAYIQYKESIREYCIESVEEWASHFYQDLDIDEHGLCLSSKLKGLKDLASKSKIK
jgi:hypothetical protein